MLLANHSESSEGQHLFGLTVGSKLETQRMAFLFMCVHDLILVEHTAKNMLKLFLLLLSPCTNSTATKPVQHC